MDSTKISNDKYEIEFANMLRQKYAGEDLELAFAVSTPALKFLTKYRQSILNNAPIVYLAVDGSRLAGMDVRTNMTGVAGHADFRPTLNTALSVLPDTKKVVVIAGNSTLDQGLLNQARLQYADYENKVELAYLTDRPLQDYQREVAQLSPGTIVIFISLFTDSAGNSYSGPDSAESVAKSSSVPVFCLSQSHLGHGMVGGSVINFGALGVGAGEMARRILLGEKAESIPSKTFESEPMFDSRELRRWNINEAALPAGSVVLFKELTIWEQYKWYVISSITFSAFEALLIAWLLYLRSRRKQAEAERRQFAALAADEHLRLDEFVANVPGIVWESHFEGSEYERRVNFVSDYVEKMLGYTPEEFASKPNFWLSVIHEEDREGMVLASKEIIEGKRSRILEFRYVTKDGLVIWAEANLVPKHDAQGKVIGVRGVAVDVTDRKLAEEELFQRELELREAQRLSRTGNWEWDLATGAVRWSEELYRIVGIDTSEPAVDWKGHPKIYTPESYDRLAMAVATALENGTPYDLEL
ncbi:MAG TPA: ABC transporter substrate binding protein, partial [Pyrinomonadaceae bacterium]|nr:ABC transporter substrate binding protein [Pyrinomonadaceae bacterium]